MYINEYEKNNIIYSLDMIRLKTFLTYSVFTEIEFRFKTCWKDYVKKIWTTPQQKQFFYNYDIEVGEGNSFWFGFCHNTERRSFCENAEYNFTIEFNPNKIKDNNNGNDIDNTNIFTKIISYVVKYKYYVIGIGSVLIVTPIVIVSVKKRRNRGVLK